MTSYVTPIILLQLLERAALLLICLFLLSKLPHFRQIFQKEVLDTKDRIILSVIFSGFAILGTYTGINVEGSLVNVRIIAIVSGGILFGWPVGLITGIVSGAHRYLIDIGGVTSVPCLITSITAGIVSGYIHNRVSSRRRWIVGIAAGMACEALTMVLILLMSHPYELGREIVSIIALPMILGQVGVGLIVLFVQGVEGERENIAARQAKLALDIANKTLPYFRSINSDSLRKICTIIRQDIHADAVAITDKRYILAYVGLGEERYNIGHEIITDATKQAISSGEIVLINDDAEGKVPNIQSLIIIPLQEKGIVTGTLKIYYRNAHKITYSLQTLAVGLSQIISTLMEVSRIEQMKEMANKAEIKALQTSINPHFLFNALNAIASSIRINPDNAREMIINLSGYLRHSLEWSDELIDINKELGQVVNYVEIEKARFGSKLQVVYDIDEVEVKMPSLIIQPLVENAIVHGILKGRGSGTVTLAVKDGSDFVEISVEDTGTGIDPDIINRVYDGSMPENRIGLSNVHQRVKLIYGEGLQIERLEKGTRIRFHIKKERSAS
ncbi:sensor histidine kinase [Paenibacillus hunanensis]|uniref:histidine kinase n=1 Tax=Paenibacillus hunanensis TaxID=539262 RepID=A0ABU1J226_9BACL|nr:sensor histidine kinase [Paenibacillus hunanensis]MDR6245563.1 two-component system LytT family sensor kinase [Paenibacillus hunanensis]GGJ09456.1 membrane protein [Paenibacillus hunanensis]